MNHFFRQLRLHILILFFAPIIGLIALITIHLLPTAPMKEHVYWSLEMIEQEFTDEILVAGYPSTLTGNFTDCLMIQHAVYSNPEHTILEQVLRMYRSETYNIDDDPEGWWPGFSLKHYVEGTPQPREVEYARYWHGYLLVLKPLLLLTSVNTIRLLNSAIQLLFAGLVVLLLTKKNAHHVAVAYLFSLPFMYFVSTYASLSLSICFYLMNIAVLFQLQFEQQIYQKQKYGIFFLIVGICTSYFDFLTYPLITLVYPLCIYFVFHAEEFFNNVKKMFLYSAEWCIGYVSMWASKWILSDLLTDSNTIKDAFSTVTLRTQSVENVNRIEGFLNVLSLHIQPFSNWCFFLILLIIFIATIIKICRIGISKTLTNLSGCVVFLLLALYPFLWLFVIQNHSVWHWQYTCRILSATIFAGVTGINAIFEIRK